MFLFTTEMLIRRMKKDKRKKRFAVDVDADDDNDNDGMVGEATIASAHPLTVLE